MESLSPNTQLHTDLLTLLPAKFLNIPYNLDPQTKLKALQDCIALLATLSPTEIDFSHDCTPIFNVLTHILEDPSIIFFTEGLRLFHSLLRIFSKKPSSFPAIRLKNCFRLLLEKNKGNSQKISAVFDQALTIKAINLEQMCEFFVFSLESSNKMSVKIVCLDNLQRLLVEKPEKRHLCDTIARKLEATCCRKDTTAKIKAKLKEIIAKLRENSANKENLAPKNCSSCEPFAEKVAETLSSAPLFRQFLRESQTSADIERYYCEFLAILLRKQRPAAVFDCTNYLQLKSLIVNCPKNLQDTEEFMRFLAIFETRAKDFAVLLRSTVKLLQKLSNNLKYLYSVEKAQVLLRMLMFSLEKTAGSLQNLELSQQETQEIVDQLQEIKVPGLANLHKPLRKALKLRLCIKKSVNFRENIKNSAEKQDLQTTQEFIPISQEKLHVSQEIIPTSKELMPISHENTPISQKNLHISQSNLPIPPENQESSQKTEFQVSIDAVSQLLRCNSSQPHWKRGIGRPIFCEAEALPLIKRTFQTFSLQEKHLMFPFVLEILESWPHFSQEIATCVFEFLAPLSNFCDTRESREHFEGFLRVFLRKCEKTVVLRALAAVFSLVLRNSEDDREKLRRLAKNALFPAIYWALDDEIQLREIEFLAEGLAFCVMDESLRHVGREILYKLARRHEKTAVCESFERFLLKNEKMYAVWRDWCEKDEIFSKKSRDLYEDFTQECTENCEKAGEFNENTENLKENHENNEDSNENKQVFKENCENIGGFNENTQDYKEKYCENLDIFNENLDNIKENCENLNIENEGTQNFKANLENFTETPQNFQENHENLLNLTENSSHFKEKAQPHTQFFLENTADLLGFCSESSLEHKPDYKSLYESQKISQKALESRFLQLNAEYLSAMQQLSLQPASNSNISRNPQQFHEFPLFFANPGENASFFCSFFTFYADSCESLEQKLQFLRTLKENVCSAVFLNNLSSVSQKNLLDLLINLCVCDQTQSFLGKGLEKELQAMLDAVLSAKKPQIRVFSLVSLLEKLLPLDFSCEMAQKPRLALRLCVKCLEKSVEAEPRPRKSATFKALAAVLALMHRHPCEKLREELPNARELESVYRGIKKCVEFLVRCDRDCVKEVVDSLRKTEEKGVFWEFLQSLLRK